MANTVSKLLNIALAEEGYLEKASNSQLDSKTANAGRGNFTKYARDLDALKTFYNTPKQGVPWCDVFVDWCFVKAFGREEAQKLLNQPNRSAGAGCGFSANYFKSINQFYLTPQPGDQIFFTDGDGSVSHTGIVYKVDNIKVYTIEGNTSGGAGVIGNGGGVFKKSYNLNDSAIYGYGRAKFDAEEEIVPTQRVLKNYCEGEDVKEVQKRLIELGYSCGPDGADGRYGNDTEEAVKKFQHDRGLEEDGKVGPATRAELKKDNPVNNQPIRVGDIIKIKKGARYTNGALIPNWVINSTCYARQKEDAKGNIVFSIQRTGAITGIVSKNYLENQKSLSYQGIIIANSGLNVRQGPSTTNKVMRVIAKNSKVTIIEERNGWGKLSTGGWVSLNYVKKI